MTGTPSSFPATSSPLCPATPGSGKPGIALYAIRIGSTTSSARNPNPEPRTIATRGFRLPSRFLTTSVASPTPQDSSQCGRQEVGQGARDHRAEAEAREIVLAVRRERADAADLNSDGAQIREAAQGERGDRERHRVQSPFQG